MPGRLKQLAKDLRAHGGAFAEGEGSLWGLSAQEMSKRESVVPPEGLQRSWVRYLHSPDIWEDDTAKHWRASAPVTPATAELPSIPDEALPALVGEGAPVIASSPAPRVDEASGAVREVDQRPLRVDDGADPLPWKVGATNARMQAIVDERKGFEGLVAAWCDVIATSSQLIDVTSLEVPAPTSTVAKRIIAAVVTAVAKAKDPLIVRLLFGGTPQSKTAEFRAALERALQGRVGPATRVLFGCDYRGVAGRKLKFVGKNKTWNHSKIVAGDGWRAITGGHNMNAEGSYTRAPVIHDLSVEVVGHGAQLAHEFATSLWVKGRRTEFLDGYTYNHATQAFVAIQDGDLDTAARQVAELRKYHADPKNNPRPEGADYVPAEAVMGVGRWGDVEVGRAKGNGVGADTIAPLLGLQYCSDHVKRLLIAGARQSICVSQQDLVNAAWKGVLGYRDAWHDGCRALGARLAAPGPIEINVVVSARYAQDADAAPYSYGNSPRVARDLIAGFAGTRIPEGNVCTVAPLVFCRAAGVDRSNYIWPDAWRGGKGFVQGHVMQSHQWGITWGFGPGNHAKAMMIDDELVLIGSDNMYPSPLAEFSFVIEGVEAAAKFREVYWAKLWKYSRRMGLKIDHSSRVDTMDPIADFKALQKSAAATKKTLELGVVSSDGVKRVQAVSILEQIEKAKSLESCYRALRFLPQDADLAKVTVEQMHDHVYGEYITATFASSPHTAPSLPAVGSLSAKPWKEVGGVKLTMTHKDMLADAREWLDDRAIDAYVGQLEAGGLVLRRFDVPVGRFVAAGGEVPPDLRAARATDREVQVLNVNGNHWIVAVRFRNENANAAYVYDSLGAQNGALAAAVVTHVRRCFHMIAASPVTRLAGPQQPQSWECGPYVCAAIELLSRTPATRAAAVQALAAAQFDNAAIRQAMANSIGA
jgi:phosphatidylserine/phosphatidylglycerophosphate/cardiolipin synthase-like enzyme